MQISNVKYFVIYEASFLFSIHSKASGWQFCLQSWNTLSMPSILEWNLREWYLVIAFQHGLILQGIFIPTWRKTRACAITQKYLNKIPHRKLAYCHLLRLIKNFIKEIKNTAKCFNLNLTLRVHSAFGNIYYTFNTLQNLQYLVWERTEKNKWNEEDRSGLFQ